MDAPLWHLAVGPAQENSPILSPPATLNWLLRTASEMLTLPIFYLHNNDFDEPLLSFGFPDAGRLSDIVGSR